MSYVLMNVVKNKVYARTNTREEMIAYIAESNTGGLGKKKKQLLSYSIPFLCGYNGILCRIAMCDGDIMPPSPPNPFLYASVHTGQYYRLYDDFGRVIDPRYWVYDVLSYQRKKEVYSPTRGIPYVYRQDPVPYVRKNQRGGAGVTPPKVMNEIRASYKDDHATYTRFARSARALYQDCDYAFRVVQRSWKSQGRKKRQWM